MLSSGIMQRAFTEAVVLGLACGPLGVWVLLHRRAYAAESLSHAMLPGLVIAALVGAPLLLGAAGGVLAAAAGIALVARDARAGGDIGVAVVVSGLFGLGGILALAPETPPRLGELLFGDLLGVTGGDLLAGAALSLGVLVALALGFRAFCATAFDRGSAAALGIRPVRADMALLALLAVTTVAAVQGLGNLLLIALILAPAAAALNLAQRLPAVLALSAALAAFAGVAGLVISYQLELAAGASVALCAVALAFLSLPFGQRVMPAGGAPR
jgi:ABC-type Mn2+/Zn2+ transport system permease subunit